MACRSIRSATSIGALLTGCAFLFTAPPIRQSQGRTEGPIGCAVHQGSKDTTCLVALEPVADPASFSDQEFQQLQRRFGVHGPQPRLAQLFTAGLDDLPLLRAHTLESLEELRPKVLAESRRRGVNTMLMAAILYDEMQHAKPGKDVPLAAHSGLFHDHGPAQLSTDELVHQGLLRPNASSEEIDAALNRLLDPEQNVGVLAGQLARLQRLLGVPSSHHLQVSNNAYDAKIAATIAFLHNGKLDYPERILRYMQDPELHALMFEVRRTQQSPLI